MVRPRKDLIWMGLTLKRPQPMHHGRMVRRNAMEAFGRLFLQRLLKRINRETKRKSMNWLIKWMLREIQWQRRMDSVLINMFLEMNCVCLDWSQKVNRCYLYTMVEVQHIHKMLFMNVRKCVWRQERQWFRSTRTRKFDGLLIIEPDHQKINFMLDKWYTFGERFVTTTKKDLGKVQRESLDFTTARRFGFVMATKFWDVHPNSWELWRRTRRQPFDFCLWNLCHRRENSQREVLRHS